MPCLSEMRMGKGGTRRAISGIISSIILIIIFISSVSVILYLQNSYFKVINEALNQAGSSHSPLVELPGDEVYSINPTTIRYVIYPDGSTNKEDIHVSSTPMSLSYILGGYGWALLVTQNGQVFNFSNIENTTTKIDGVSLIGWLPPGSVIGGYSIQSSNGQLFYYIPGQYDIVNYIPDSLKGYVASSFTNFEPYETQGFTYTYPLHYLYGSIYNASIMFPFQNGSSITLKFSWTLSKILESRPFSYTERTIIGNVDLGHATLPISLVIISPYGNEYLWIEYHSYSQYFLTPLPYVYACVASNLMDNADIGYYTVDVNGYQGIAQAHNFSSTMLLTIQDTPKGLEFLVNGAPLVFNTVARTASYSCPTLVAQDTPYIPAHLDHGIAILNLPAGQYAKSSLTPDCYTVDGNPVVTLSSLNIDNQTRSTGSASGMIFQVGKGGITLVNTGIFCPNTEGTLYFYKVNVTLDSTSPVPVLAEPVNFEGNELYIGSWTPFAPNDVPLVIYPGTHSYTFYFGVISSYVNGGGILVTPSLSSGSTYYISIPLSNGETINLEVVSYQ